MNNPNIPAPLGFIEVVRVGTAGDVWKRMIDVRCIKGIGKGQHPVDGAMYPDPVSMVVVVFGSTHFEWIVLGAPEKIAIAVRNAQFTLLQSHVSNTI